MVGAFSEHGPRQIALPVLCVIEIQLDYMPNSLRRNIRAGQATCVRLHTDVCRARLHPTVLEGVLCVIIICIGLRSHIVFICLQLNLELRTPTWLRKC